MTYFVWCVCVKFGINDSCEWNMGGWVCWGFENPNVWYFDCATFNWRKFSTISKYYFVYVLFWRYESWKPPSKCLCTHLIPWCKFGSVKQPNFCLVCETCPAFVPKLYVCFLCHVRRPHTPKCAKVLNVHWTSPPPFCRYIAVKIMIRKWCHSVLQCWIQ